MSKNWDKGLPSEGMKAKVNWKCHVSFVSLGRRARSTIKMLFILYFESGPESESESEPESESIRSPESESESESEQPHHDSAPLVYSHAYYAKKCYRSCHPYNIGNQGPVR